VIANRRAGYPLRVWGQNLRQHAELLRQVRIESIGHPFVWELARAGLREILNLFSFFNLLTFEEIRSFFSSLKSDDLSDLKIFIVIG
jgi:hypothetical protein